MSPTEAVVAVKVTGCPTIGVAVDDVRVVVVVVVAHCECVIVLVSRVTAPLRASARPSMVAPVVAVIDVRAMMFPRKAVPVPKVAELPTCQKTLHAWAPPIRFTLLFEPVVRVEAIWKMKTACELP